MKQITFLLLIIFYSNSSFGQKYLTKEIRAKADSTLKQYLGDDVFNNYCFYDTNTYYEYKNIFGTTKWETLDKYNKTRGDFVSANIRWNLIIPYPKCNAFDTIKGSTHFTFNNLLQAKSKPDLDFIPDFFWDNDSCNLIIMQEAINIASQHGMQNIDTKWSRIVYNSELKIFTWELCKILNSKRDRFGNAYGDMQIIWINARTKTITSYHKTSFRERKTTSDNINNN